MKKDGILLGVLTLLLAGLWLVPPPVLPVGGAGKMIRVKVLEADNSDLQKHGLLLYGSQH